MSLLRAQQKQLGARCLHGDMVQGDVCAKSSAVPVACKAPTTQVVTLPFISRTKKLPGS